VRHVGYRSSRRHRGDQVVEVQPARRQRKGPARGAPRRDQGIQQLRHLTPVPLGSSLRFVIDSRHGILARPLDHQVSSRQQGRTVPIETGPVETRSVYARAFAALRDGQTAAARDLTAQILAEAEEARDLFPPFIARARDYLLAGGLTAGQLAAEEDRLSALLDGAGEGVDPQAAWHSLQAGADEALGCCAAGQ